jgi:hypothetical protein
MLFRFDGPPPAGVEHIRESDLLPLGSDAAVRDYLTAALPGTQWDDDRHGSATGDGFAIEFSLSDRNPVDHLWLRVVGGGDVISAIMSVAVPAGWSVLDISTGAFLDPIRPSDEGWAGFQAFRNRVLARGTPGGEG